MRRQPQKLILDGDVIAYRAAAAAEKPIKWDDDNWVLYASESEVKVIIEDMVYGIMGRSKIPRATFCLTSQKNFRHDILPSYKSHRKETRKPMLLSFAKEYLNVLGDTVTLPNLEGDDVIGILAGVQDKYDYVIWSLDKDLKTVPGKHINTKNGHVYTISTDEADYKWMTQVLTGDTSDGYKGCPKSGEKDAIAVLGDTAGGYPLEELWKRVVARYKKAGLTEQDALTQARVARILRPEDYDFETGRLTLWRPPFYLEEETDKLIRETDKAKEQKKANWKKPKPSNELFDESDYE